jgi:homeobox protein cut-like
MIPTLDNTASEIVQYQRDSTVQRKDLAQKTKDFRKLEDSGKLAEIKGLLKGWCHAGNPGGEMQAYTAL